MWLIRTKVAICMNTKNISHQNEDQRHNDQINNNKEGRGLTYRPYFCGIHCPLCLLDDCCSGGLAVCSVLDVFSSSLSIVIIFLLLEQWSFSGEDISSITIRSLFTGLTVTFMSSPFLLISLLLTPILFSSALDCAVSVENKFSLDLPFFKGSEVDALLEVALEGTDFCLAS